MYPQQSMSGVAMVASLSNMAIAYDGGQKGDRESGLVRQLNEMERALIALHDEIDVLEKQLAAVLTPVQPSPADQTDMGTPSMPKSPVCDTQENYSFRVRSYCERISRMRSRLHV